VCDNRILAIRSRIAICPCVLGDPIKGRRTCKANYTRKRRINILKFRGEKSSKELP